MDWDRLRVFHAVADAGSFTHAGDHLGLSQSAISRQIGALEQDLNVVLFQRHARGLSLTDQGHALLRTVRDVFQRLANVETEIHRSRVEARGTLRVTAPVGFGSTWLVPRIREFVAHYPDIKLTLLLDDQQLDLSMREADIAIRASQPHQPDLVQRPIKTIRFGLYGHSDYLQRRGTPRKLEDLAAHDLVGLAKEARWAISEAQWLRDTAGEGAPGARAVLRLNNAQAILEAVSSGLALGPLPDYMVEDRPALIRVLPDIAETRIELFFVYPEELRNIRRITAFRDFLLGKLAEGPGMG